MSRTVIEHSGISPRRIGHGKRNIPTAVAQFYSSFYGPVLALFSLTLPSLYFCAVRQRAVGNEYLRCTSPRPGVPARETSAYHTEFTALPPPQLATYKVTNLQYCCAAPYRACKFAFFMNENWRTYTAATIVHVTWIPTSSEETHMDVRYSSWSHVSISGFGSHSRSEWIDVYRRRGFRIKCWIVLGNLIRTRLKPLQSAIICLLGNG